MLTDDLCSKLLTFSEIEAPKEMCGLLFGSGFLTCQNTAKNPQHEFNIEHEEYEWACSWMGGEKPWAIVHSHPGRSAGLSAKDCALMDALQLATIDMAMVIVGMEPVEIRCFKKVGELYSLQGVYRIDAHGKWCGPKMGAVVGISRHEAVP